MLCGRNTLTVVTKHLFQFFAGSEAGKNDVDIVRLKSAQEDHLLRQVNDLYGLSHIEHKDVTAFAECGGLQNQRYGFGNGHEKTCDFWVCYGDRTTSSNL